MVLSTPAGRLWVTPAVTEQGFGTNITAHWKVREDQSTLPCIILEDFRMGFPFNSSNTLHVYTTSVCT